MKKILVASFCFATSITGVALENKLPEGVSLEGRIAIDYDEEKCGPMEFRLDQNDDCTIEFLDFFAATDFKPVRICDVTITVDMPDDVRMGPSLFSIEGEYQVGSDGVASIEAHYGLEGFQQAHVGQTFRGTEDSPTQSDAFLLQDSFGTDGPSSDCGGIAVFKGRFLLGAKKAGDGLESEIVIDKSEREQISIWGWDYASCGGNSELPDYCDGIAGDPDLKDIYPECHPD